MKKNRVIVDGHCDTIEVAFDKRITIEDTSLMFNLKKVGEQLPYIQVLATFIHTDYVLQNLDNGFDRGNEILDNFEQQYLKLKQNYPILKIQNLKQLQQAYKEKKLGMILSTENGAIIGTKVENINHWYQRGIRVMGITWNDDNLLGCGALTKQDNGLTEFGKLCVDRMNTLGILVDVSHTSYHTFLDVSKLANQLLATHSNVYSICQHPRNLKDDQIKEIAQKEGVIGICFYDKFLKNKGKSTIDDIVQHILYIKNLVGIDYVGLGSDFDGVDANKLPTGIIGVESMNVLIEHLLKQGFTLDEVDKVMGVNFVRVLENSLKN